MYKYFGESKMSYLAKQYAALKNSSLKTCKSDKICMNGDSIFNNKHLFFRNLNSISDLAIIDNDDFDSASVNHNDDDEDDDFDGVLVNLYVVDMILLNLELPKVYLFKDSNGKFTILNNESIIATIINILQNPNYKNDINSFEMLNKFSDVKIDFVIFDSEYNVLEDVAHLVSHLTS